MKIIRKKLRREYKTNYLKRKRLLESGKPRVVIRKTNRYIIIQHVESNIARDEVKRTVISKELLKYGWPIEKNGSLKNLAACYLTGLLFGKRVMKGSGKENREGREFILDMGLVKSTKGSRIYSALKGIAEAGVKIKYKERMLPDEKRIANKNEFFNKVREEVLK